MNMMDGRLTFFPIPKSPEMRKGKAGVRPTKRHRFEERRLYMTEAIRDGVMKKAGRYGELDLPYVIAINALDKYMLVLMGRKIIERYLLEALCGPDGALRSESGPRYTRVSAVLLTTLQSPWDMSSPMFAFVIIPGLKSRCCRLTRFRSFSHKIVQWNYSVGHHWEKSLACPRDGHKWPGADKKPMTATCYVAYNRPIRTFEKVPCGSKHSTSFSSSMLLLLGRRGG